jgi:hypothetical protein
METDAEEIARLTYVSLKMFLISASMNSGVDYDSAVQTILILTSLNKTTCATDDADSWKFDFICITKDTFSSVVKLKLCIARRTPGFIMLGFDTLVRAKWAG